MTNRTIRVMIADDHPIFRLGIKTMIASVPDLQLVAEAEDGNQALEMVQQHRPDVLLLDVQLGRTNGLEVLKRLSTMELETRAVLLTAAIDRAQTRVALMRGAWGVLLKQTASQLLIKCIRQVMQGEFWVGRDSVGDLVHALRNPGRPEDAPNGGLTMREREIVERVVTGASNKDIAWQLGLGEQTVKNHLRKIFDKLHVQNRVELALLAVEQKLIGSEDAPPAVLSATAANSTEEKH